MGKVNWKKERVSLVVKGASQKALTAVAARVEAHAKENIVANNQVDTGFMLNSVYHVGKGESTYDRTKPTGTYPWAVEKHGGKAGRVQQVQPPETQLPNVDSPVAMVVCHAKYAVFQEIKRSFLYKALEQTAREAGGIIQTVARKEMHD